MEETGLHFLPGDVLEVAGHGIESQPVIGIHVAGSSGPRGSEAHALLGKRGEWLIE